ncbi:hypothetical protein [Salipaludibacillus neizhouensis]|nr:hypothetical protein [Salipaludibacillus neizhouensis]
MTNLKREEYLLLAPTSLKKRKYKFTNGGGTGNPPYDIKEAEKIFLHQLA